MAKVPFSKLGLKVNNDITIITFNDYDIEVKHYLPFKEKTELASNIINYSVDDNGFYNPLKVKLYMVLEVVYAYTNLTFTPKMKEDPFKLYDALVSSGLFEQIIHAIDPGDWAAIQKDVWDTIENIYNYRNSAMGILEMISTDYSNLQLNAEDITDKLLNPESLSTLKALAPLA